MILSLALHATLSAALTPALAGEPAEPVLANESWRRMYLEASLPDPHLAFNESLVLGFGSGHFYSHDKMGGYIHLGVQGGGLAMIGTGIGIASSQGWYDTPEYALMGVGALTFLTGRIVDMITAPTAAHRYAAKRIAEEGAKKDE